jgi:hypothetical protein
MEKRGMGCIDVLDGSLPCTNQIACGWDPRLGGELYKYWSCSICAYSLYVHLLFMFILPPRPSATAERWGLCFLCTCTTQNPVLEGTLWHRAPEPQLRTIPRPSVTGLLPKSLLRSIDVGGTSSDHHHHRLRRLPNQLRPECSAHQSLRRMARADRLYPTWHAHVLLGHESGPAHLPRCGRVLPRPVCGHRVYEGPTQEQCVVCSRSGLLCPALPDPEAHRRCFAAAS